MVFPLQSVLIPLGDIALVGLAIVVAVVAVAIGDVAFVRNSIDVAVLACPIGNIIKDCHCITVSEIWFDA